jgi:hypothetical protein
VLPRATPSTTAASLTFRKTRRLYESFCNCFGEDDIPRSPGSGTKNRGGCLFSRSVCWTAVRGRTQPDEYYPGGVGYPSSVRVLPLLAAFNARHHRHCGQEREGLPLAPPGGQGSGRSVRDPPVGSCPCGWPTIGRGLPDPRRSCAPRDRFRPSRNHGDRDAPTMALVVGRDKEEGGLRWPRECAFARIGRQIGGPHPKSVALDGGQDDNALSCTRGSNFAKYWIRISSAKSLLKRVPPRRGPSPHLVQPLRHHSRLPFENCRGCYWWCRRRGGGRAG